MHDERTRKKIQVSQIINRLHKHLDGEVELTPAQVSSAKLLLDKSLPSLSAVDFQGEVKVDPVSQILGAIDGKTKDVLDDDTVH